MKKILIFTNECKVKYLHSRFVEALGTGLPTEAEPISHLNEGDDAEWVKVDDFKKEGVYMIFDSLSDPAFEDLKSQCKGDEISALYHSLPVRRNELPGLSSNTACREGRHEPGNFYYSKVFEILTDNEKDKGKRIEELLKYSEREIISNAVHAFLIGCSMKQTETEQFRNAYDTLKNNRRISDKVTRFFEYHRNEITEFIKIQEYLLDWKKKL